MRIWAGRRIFRLQWRKIELIEDRSNSVRHAPWEETQKENTLASSFQSPRRRTSREHRPSIESVEATHAALLSWNYWKSFKKGGASFLRQAAEQQARCAYYPLSDVAPCQGCQNCQNRAESLLRNVEVVLEQALKLLWQDKARTLLFGRRFRIPEARQRVPLSKRRKFYQAIGLCEGLDERLDTLPAELVDCYYTVRAAFTEYRYNVLHPMWQDICRRRREEIFDSLRALTTHFTTVLATLNAAGTQTAFALRERKLLCTSRGGLANEQHLYSIFIAHLSTIAPQLAPRNALFGDITGNRGGRHAGALPM